MEKPKKLVRISTVMFFILQIAFISRFKLTYDRNANVSFYNLSKTFVQDFCVFTKPECFDV